MKLPRIYVLTGPESTGKTTLAVILAEQLGAALVPEYARIYLQQNGPAYDVEDFRKMFEGQIGLEEGVISSAAELIICDTDVLTFMIWSQDKYKRVDQTIIDRLAAHQDRKYLLCKPDIAWKADEFRENPDDASELFEQYRTTLEAYGLQYQVVSGSGEERIKKALACFQEHNYDTRSSNSS